MGNVSTNYNSTTGDALKEHRITNDMIPSGNKEMKERMRNAQFSMGDNKDGNYNTSYNANLKNRNLNQAY